MALECLFRRIGLNTSTADDHLCRILLRRTALALLTDQHLKRRAQEIDTSSVEELFALVMLIAERTLGLKMFETQILGALAMQSGQIAEMQTGEGKTLAAVPAVIWYALHRRGIHVLTANDYLAERDAMGMRDVYEWFGLSVAFISQSMGKEKRREAYSAAITYVSANEVGFDYLRDGLAQTQADLVLRPFAFALIDEVDSILIDEARIPLVIAGGVQEEVVVAYRVENVVAALREGSHYTLDEFHRNANLTDIGIREIEMALACGSLFEPANLNLLAAVQDALHAHALLRRNVDYLVQGDAIAVLNEITGRIANNRRWPAGLQSALEAKECLHLNPQGRILGSITVENLVALYERICGMTGTAATQAEEFWKYYKLVVTVIPPHCSVLRQDLPDLIFPNKQTRDNVLLEKIQLVHESRRPVLVGAASVEESEALSVRLRAIGIKHAVLNARNHHAEAPVIAQAGALDAVTISTNMAGRGIDILLGGDPPKDREQVLALGGLLVIGLSRHESRRIDRQLRGRSGRQGDPGTSVFMISLQDDLLVRFGAASADDIELAQRTAESQSLETREMLSKYERSLEGHRREVYKLRSDILISQTWTVRSVLTRELYSELVSIVDEPTVEAAGRRVTLARLDELWTDYLANIAELKGGIQWASWTGDDPLYKFLKGAEAIMTDFWDTLEREVNEAFADPCVFKDTRAFAPLQQGATWTYLTTDQPFGSMTERIIKGWKRLSGKAR